MAAALLIGPSNLFQIPRQRPLVWLLILLIYPVVSAYPQELIYRAFFFHRYADLFGGPRRLIAVNAVLFGWAHIIVHSLTAMIITTVGGLLLAVTYARSRSTLLVSAEHALYGDFVLTVGFGGMFVNSVRRLSALFN